MLYGSPVSIKSKFTADQIAQMRAEHLAIPGEARREQIGVFLQKIPLIGRVIAHCTSKCSCCICGQAVHDTDPVMCVLLP